MSPENRNKLASRVTTAAEDALAAKGYVSAVDVLLGIRWLDPSTLKRWQQGQVDYLERAVQTNLPRITEAMKMFHRWAAAKGLLASETAYAARNAQRHALRFSRSGDPGIEARYRTHWVLPELSEKKRERLATQASKPPDLVVMQPLNKDWKCHRCGGLGDLLIMEPEAPACMACAGLGDLVFLPSGDALLTRRAKARSARFAVVVRFSRARKRYERQGLLVEAPALEEAEREIAAGKGP